MFVTKRLLVFRNLRKIRHDFILLDLYDFIFFDLTWKGLIKSIEGKEEIILVIFHTNFPLVLPLVYQYSGW